MKRCHAKRFAPSPAHLSHPWSTLPLLPPSIRKFILPEREQFRSAPADARARSAAWVDMLLVDFGFARLIWKNRAQLSPRLWRSNQPMPGDIAYAKTLGIRTIISARHDLRHGGNALEIEACAALGLAFLTLPFFSREAPASGAILEAADALGRVEFPALIHCKSGADRAGFLSALALIVVEKAPVRLARDQLALRFLHIRQSKTGILDAVFDSYLAAHPDEAKPFLDWVREDYDPAALTHGFRHGYWADLLDRFIFRHE